MINRPDDSAGVRRANFLPAAARWLGYAGLLPQAAAVATLASRSDAGRLFALAFAYAYAALILSFLGGLWWGLAASDPAKAPRWAWIAAVLPSLLALASAAPWMIGGTWPGPSLVFVGVLLGLSVLVDHRLRHLGLAPDGWMALRVRLSIGLGLLTLAAALLQ